MFVNTTSCLHRCDLFTYTLVEEPVSAADEELEFADFYLYFGSPSLEVWTEFRLMSFLDCIVGVGGAVGLILGMSALSVLHVLTESLAKALKLMMTTSKSRSAKKF